MSAEEVCLRVLLCGDPLRWENCDVLPDGLTPQQEALLAKDPGAGSSQLPYEGDGRHVVQVELHDISGTRQL